MGNGVASSSSRVEPQPSTKTRLPLSKLNMMRSGQIAGPEDVLPPGDISSGLSGLSSTVPFTAGSPHSSRPALTASSEVTTMCDAQAPRLPARQTSPDRTATSVYGPMGDSSHCATKTPPSVQPKAERRLSPSGVTRRACSARTHLGWYSSRALAKR
eukprot:scaffold204992_cov33-Tisochrysis_lutea.AAC.3